MKRLHALLLLLALALLPLLAQEQEGTGAPGHYRVQDIVYTTGGITQPAALKREVDVNRDLTFATEEDLADYLDKIVQELEDTRLFKKIDASYELLPADGDGIIPALFHMAVETSFSVLAFPKPSYSSNSGAELEVKFKDKNFLGLLNPLDISVLGQLGTSDDPDDFSKVTLGFDFSYDYPFTIGPTNETWENDFSIYWLLGEDRPDFSYSTGLSVGIPLGHHSLNLNVTQAVSGDPDYVGAGDYLYFTESASVSLPLVLGYIDKTIPITYTPSVSAKYYWDLDGVEHSDLKGLRTTMQQSIGISQVNWQGNFRRGYSFSTTQALTYNWYTESLNPVISATATAFKDFKYVGLNARVYAYHSVNDRQNNMGSKLRGIRDSQDYDDSSLGEALSTNLGLVFNFDMPIHIITTDWLGWGYRLFGAYDDLPRFWHALFWLPHKLFTYLDFELQIAPFLDVGLTHNVATGNTFSYKDGFYSAGLEFLVYPQRWKSYVVRGSVGVDIGRKLLKSRIDRDWRDTSVSTLEIYIGLGLHY